MVRILPTIIIIIIIIIECVHNYTSTYVRKQGYNKKHRYEHVPKSVEIGQGGNVTMLWNQQVQTDRTIRNNKPDIIIRNNEKRTCMLIDVAISGDRNMIKKEAERKF
jgi:hypothetical protein